MRKLILPIFCLSVALAGSVYAKPSPEKPTASPFDGTYAGLGIGFNGSTFGINNTDTFATDGTAALTSYSGDARHTNQLTLQGEMTLGYGEVFPSQFYLGLFGFIDLAQHQKTNFLNITNQSGSSTIQDNKTNVTKLANLTGGLALKPGILLTPQTLLFAVLGWENGTETVTARHSVQITTAASGAANTSLSYDVNGLKLGIGFQTQISQALFLSVRYLITDFFTGHTLNTPNQTTTGSNLLGPYSYTADNQRIDTHTVLTNIDYFFGRRAPFHFFQPIQPDNFNGYYTAAQIGMGQYANSGATSQVNGSYIDQGAINNNPTLTSSFAQDQTATALRLAFGLGHVFCKRYYLGVEAGLKWQEPNIDSTSVQAFRPITVSVGGQSPDIITHRTQLSTWSFVPSLDAKLGLIFAQRVLSYLRIGFDINRTNLTTSDSLTYFNQNGTRSVITLSNATGNHTEANLRLGAGFAFQFSPGNAFLLDYTHTFYGRLNARRIVTATDAANNTVSLSDTSSTRLSNNVVTIGYTRYFQS